MKKEILSEEKALLEGKIGYFVPIEQLKLSQRTLNFLRYLNCPYLGEVLMYSEEDVLKFRNIGEKSLKELKEILKKFELTFSHSFEHVDWLPDNHMEISQKYFPPFISVEKAFELFWQGKVFDIRKSEINEGLLIPLTFIPTFASRHFNWLSEMGYTLVGDLVSSLQLQARKQYKANRPNYFNAFYDLIEKLGFEYKDCSVNWKSAGDIYSLSAKKFPNQELVIAFIEKHNKA
ncbi:MAG: DNA-directed RNA polymerase subunit alpha C-terminal domain-containing protein [Alphaproteobacteria bacterium]|nr:DNA-directed RNA polymerase subunit alpha C-terminal domain-containing protein [Alphaproteobacteria bacterium]